MTQVEEQGWIDYKRAWPARSGRYQIRLQCPHSYGLSVKIIHTDCYFERLYSPSHWLYTGNAWKLVTHWRPMPVPPLRDDYEPGEDELVSPG